MSTGFGSDHAASWRDDEAGELYERGRAGYPPEVGERLAGELGIGPGSVVVDVAAGTGKLTRLVAGIAGRVIAVEPAAGMRRVLARAVPGVAVVSGLAESLPLAAGSVDGVTVGQAFHWFRHADALDEFARVLRPGGALVLVWNVDDAVLPGATPFDDAVLPGATLPVDDGGPGAEIRRLCDRFEQLRPRPPVRWRPRPDAMADWGPLGSTRIEGTEELGAATLVERVASRSFVLLLGAADREALLREVRRVAESAAGCRGSVTLPTTTIVYWVRRR